MDFHVMKRKDLQILCKKHGIPANLKNSEMATRLASFFKKETEEFVTETETPSEGSIKADGIKENQAVSKEVKKVRFSHENEVFEFTRSVKKLPRKSVRTRSQGSAQDLKLNGVELKLSKKSVAKRITVTGANEKEANKRSGIVETEKVCSLLDATKGENVPRRSKRIRSSGSTQEVCKVTDFMDLKEVEDKDSLKGLSGNKHDQRSNIDVPRNIQDQRRSTRLKARSSDDRPSSSTKESTEERKTKQSKPSAKVNTHVGELVKNKTEDPLIDSNVQKTDINRRVKVHVVSKIEKVPRRSKRLGSNVNVSLVDENVKAVKHDDQEIENAPKRSRKREKSVSELLVDGQAQKGDKHRGDVKPLRRSKRTALDNMLGQAVSNSPNGCSVIDSEQDGATIDNVNDEMQVHVRFTRNYSKKGSFKAAIVVDENLVDKKTDETFDYLVKSPKRVTRRMQRDRLAEQAIDEEIASTQDNLTLKKPLDQYAQSGQEEAGGANVKARGSSKKSKTTNQECIKDLPHIIIEDSPSPSDTKATESAMIIENILDSTPDNSADNSQRTNTQVLKSELMEGEFEEKLDRDTVLMAVTEDRDEVRSHSLLHIECLSSASVPLAVSNPEAELHVPGGHIVVKDIASTVIVEENTNTKEDPVICTPESELKEHSCVAKLTKVKAILGDSAKFCKEIHLSKDDEHGSLEKDLQAINLPGNFFEYNTKNSSAEEEMETSKVGCMSFGRCVSLTPEKLLDAYTQLESEEKEGPEVEATGSTKKIKSVNQECIKDIPQEMVEDSPFASETKATEHVMTSNNVLDSAPKCSVDISPRRNTQELNSEIKEGEGEEQHEPEKVQMAMIKDKEEASSLSAFLIERSEVSNPESELFKEATPPPTSAHDLPSVNIFVSNLVEEEAFLKNSAEYWNKIHSSKDDEKKLLEKEIQAENLHQTFSEYKTENSRVEEQTEISKVGCISVVRCVNLETLDEVKDDSLEKSERTNLNDVGRKLNELELGGWSLTDFASLSPKEENFSECFEKDEMKALSQPVSVPIHKAATSALDESVFSTTRERSLMLMEQFSENGKTCATDLVTQENDGTVESPAVIFTAPKQVLFLEDAGIDEAKNKEEHTAPYFPDDSAILNTTERCFTLAGSRKTEARIEEESIVVELHDEYNIAASPLRQYTVGDFKGDGLGRNEENRTVKHHCEYDTCTIPDSHALLGNSVSDGTENNGGNKANEFYEESIVFTGLKERHEIFGYSGQDRAREGEVEKAAHNYEESGLSTRLHKDRPLADPELGLAGGQGINVFDKSGLCTSLERQFFDGDSEQMKAGKTAEKADSEFHDESAVLNSPERHPFPEESELAEAAKSEEKMVGELQVDCDMFIGAEKQLLLETDEGMHEDIIIAMSLDMSDTITASEGRSLMGDFEPSDGENKYREDKDVELLGGSNISTNLERHLISGDPGLDGTRKVEDNTAATCEEESFVFTSPERRLLLGISEPRTAGKQERKEVESGHDRLGDNKCGSSQYQSHHASSPKVILKEHVSALDFRENTIADSSGSIASKVSYRHEFNACQKTVDAEFIPKGSQAENVVGNCWNSPHVIPENKDVELLGEFNISTNLERHLLSWDSGLGGTRKVEDNTAAICEEESFIFTSPERQLLIGISEPHTAGKQKGNEVEFKEESAFFTRRETPLLLGDSGHDQLGNSKSGSSQYQSHHASSPKVILNEDSHVAALDFRENTIADSSGSIASKVYYSHEFNACKETVDAEFIPKSSQADNAVGLDAIQGTSKQSRENSPHVNSVNLFDFDIEWSETTMEAERNVSVSSYVVALPAKGNSETICSIVSEESGPSTDIQNQIYDALEELAITDKNEVDELVEAKVTKNTQRDYKGNLLSDSLSGSSLSGKTSLLASTEDDNLGTCEKNGRKFIEDEASVPIATAFGADDEIIWREDTPRSPEDTMKEYLNIEESGKLSEKQVRREQILMYRTQVKPKRQDMKENVANSKIVDNLNVTAPRRSKRHPLQGLMKN